MAAKVAYKMEEVSKEVSIDPYFLFLPGSRKEHYENIIPLYSETVKILKKQEQKFQSTPFIISIHSRKCIKYIKENNRFISL